jgi:hypothetical protein
MSGMPQAMPRGSLHEDSSNIASNVMGGLQVDAGTEENEKSRPFSTPISKGFASRCNMADWADLRIGTSPSSKRIATSQSMNAVQRDPRPVTRGGKAPEVDKSSVSIGRPATRSGMASRGKTAHTTTSNMSASDIGFDFWQDQDYALPAHFRLKSSINEQPRGRTSNISIHLPEHTPASFVASKSLHFFARYKEASATKYRVGCKSLRLQKILELLADIASAQELSCPALGSIHKDLSAEIFSQEVEGHDASGGFIPMTWQVLCGNLRRELEDAGAKLSIERTRNEVLLQKNQAMSADIVVKDEKMSAVQVRNDLIMLEQKSRLDEVQKQKIKLQELASSHQQLEAAFWSSDVTRRAYKAALVHEANIEMNTMQQYVQKSEDAFQQLLSVHKATLAKAHDIQKDSYAKDDLVTRLLNEIKETTLIHTRQEGLLVVYQDRVNNSVAKTIYDAVEDDLTQKNEMVIKLHEQNAKLSSMISALEKELEFRSRKGRKDGSQPLGTAELLKSFSDFQHQGKKTVANATSKDKTAVQPVERLEYGEDSRDEVVIPNFFVDGLCRRPGRVGNVVLPRACFSHTAMTFTRAGRMVGSLRKELEAQGEPLSWIQLINQCILNMDSLERDLKEVGKQMR